MNQTFSLKEKTKQIFILLIPILITQLGMFSMVFFNTIMSGKYNSAELAGVAIGSSIWNPIFTGLSGILLAVSPIAALLKIGVPMGLSTFFETSMFAIVTILISKFRVTTVAAYQSALNIVSFLYMIPISISMALTVLVGYEVGARRYKDARDYRWLGLVLAVVIVVVTGLFVVGFRYQVAGLYSNEPAVIKLTAYFLIFALFFQISDAIQATAQAALRGYKDVNLAFIMTLFAYWAICLPVGYALAHFTGLGARGYWIGLTIGLLAAGIALSIRLLYIQKRKFAPGEMKEAG